MDKITKACRAARLELGWSQEDAASEMDCHVATIKRLERGLSTFSRTSEYLCVLGVPESKLAEIVKEAGGMQ